MQLYLKFQQGFLVGIDSNIERQMIRMVKTILKKKLVDLHYLFLSLIIKLQ